VASVAVTTAAVAVASAAGAAEIAVAVAASAADVAALVAVTTAVVRAAASAAVVDIAGKFCTVSKLAQHDGEASNWMPPFFVHGAR
ncbi:hypothetical protein, partial [Enorma massiliensis]